MLEAKCKFVMPAAAGIQVRSRFKFRKCLDSGLRRKDGTPIPRLRTNFRTPLLEIEDCSAVVRIGLPTGIISSPVILVAPKLLEEAAFF